MKRFLAVAVSTLLAFPAIATTYSGTGAIIDVVIPGVYTTGDVVTWSFTVGGPIATPLGPASELTAFNLTVSGQTWTLADYYPLLPIPNLVTSLGGSMEVLFQGLNSNNAFLLTGVQIFGGFGMSPETAFIVAEPVATFDPSNISPAGIGALGGPPAPAVPEPASWAMLIAGFGLTGAIARRRRLAAAS